MDQGYEWRDDDGDGALQDGGRQLVAQTFATALK